MAQQATNNLGRVIMVDVQVPPIRARPLTDGTHAVLGSEHPGVVVKSQAVFLELLNAADSTSLFRVYAGMCNTCDVRAFGANATALRWVELDLRVVFRTAAA